MKKQISLSTLIAFLIVNLCVFITKAQSVPNPVSFNTAVNSSLNGTIPLDSNDLSWTSSSVSINGPYVPAVRASNQTAWLVSPYATANWITYPFSCTPNPVEHGCAGAVDIYFKLEFTLPPLACGDSVNTAGGYCLTMNYFADNCIQEIFVNGVSSYNYTGTANPYFIVGFTAGTGATVTICNNWQAGTNTLIAHVRSSPPTIGLLAFITATATTPGGFNVTPTATNVTCNGYINGRAAVSLPGYSGPASYTWLPTGGTASITPPNLSPGTYTVKIQLPLCALTNTLTVLEPTLAVNHSAVGDPKCRGTPLTFTASGAQSYSWSPGGYSGSVVTLTPFTNTIYTLTGTDSLGCKAKRLFTVIVLDCAGIGENTLHNLEIRNSIGGNLVIVTNIDRECKLQLFNLNGGLKYSTIVFRQCEIDVSDFPSGIYILKLLDNSSTTTRRVVIQ